MAEMGCNELQISGDDAELRRFRDQTDERLALPSGRDPYNGHRPSLLSFHRLMPVPADVEARDYGAADGGCQWQRTHWGVKWGASGARLNEEQDALTYSFETAWYPPLPLLRNVSADYPSLTFHLTFIQPISHSQEEFAFQNGNAIEIDL